jgi:hypothetical protein
MSPAVAVAEEEMARGQELFAQQEYAKTREALERVLESLRSEQSTRAGEIRQAARDLREVTQAATEDAAVTAGLEFRSGDPGVVPPVPQAHLPPKPSPRTPPNTLQVMEIRINADGRVDSAKFVINRPSFRNSWWTAAAKAWRFTPATKDGRPVRYVMRIVMDDADGVR